MPEDTRSDETLAIAYQNNDESAVAVLIRRHEKDIWKFAYRSSHYKDRQFIDDILQITFVLIFRLLKNRKFKPEYAGSFKAWALSICKKVTLDENRYRRHQEKPISTDYLGDLSADITARRFADSMDTLRNEERTEKLHRALARLDQRERKLVDLRNQEPPLPFNAIKDMQEFLGNNAGQLRTEYCRILERLRGYMEGMTIRIIRPGKEIPEETHCILGNLSGAQ